jgi:hypothetical protein
MSVTITPRGFSIRRTRGSSRDGNQTLCPLFLQRKADTSGKKGFKREEALLIRLMGVPLRILLGVIRGLLQQNY